MNFFKKLLGLTALLLPLTVGAALTEPDRALVERGRNLLLNGGFEQGKAQWTASGGTFTANTTAANVGWGSVSGSWASSGSAQTLTSKLIAVPPGLYGRNAVASCIIKAASGTATHTIQGWDGSTKFGAQTINSSTSNFLRSSSNVFIAPSTGSIAVQISSVSGSEPQIYIDECYIGPAEGYNIGYTTPQAIVLGGVVWPGTASCTWTQAATTQSYTSFTANASCTLPAGANITGAASAPATKIPAITFASMPAGDYEIIATGKFQPAANRSCSYQFYDGTNGYEAGVISAANSTIGADGNTIVARFTYGTPQSNVTLQVRGTGFNSSDTCNIEATTAQYNDFRIYVKYFPSAASQVVNSNVTPASWSGYHTSISAGCSSASLTYIDPSACTNIALTQTTNRNFGTVTTAAGSLPGIIVSFPRVGNYQVCSTVQLFGNNAHTLSARLVDGTGTVIDPGKGSSSSANNTLVPLCGIYNATSTAATTLKVQIATDNVSFAANIPAVVAAGSAQIQWTIVELDAPMPSPILTGSLTSDAAYAEKIARISLTSICSSGTCTAATNNGFSSCTWSSTGVYNCGLSAAYSAVPTCSIMATGESGAASICRADTVNTTSSNIRVNCFTSGSVTAVNAAYQMMCVGPR